jgi:hypothetical protein
MFRNVKIGKLTIYVIFIGLLIFFFANAIPAMIKEHEANKIRWQIEQLEFKIEANKQERLRCETNMKLWNEANEWYREEVKELVSQYNDKMGLEMEVPTQPVKREEKANLHE